MASDWIKNNVIGMVMFALFGFFFIAGIVGMGLNYGKATEQIGGGVLNSSKFANSIGGISDNSSKVRDRLVADPNLQYEGNTENDRGILGIVSDVGNFMILPFTVLAEILVNALGIPIFFMDVIRGLLILMIILGLWRLIRIGD